MPIHVQTPKGVVEFPDGTAPAVIEKALREQFPPEVNSKSEDFSQFGPMQLMMRDQAGVPSNDSGRVLPMVGGAVGGALGAAGGPVGAVAGAGLGGGAGESLRQIAERMRGRAVPATSGEAAKDIGISAAVNAGAEGVGQAAKVALPAIGRYMMTKAVRPTLAVAEKYRTTAPKIVQTLLDEGVNVTQAGVERLQSILSATNKELQSMLDASPATISKARVLDRVQDAAEKVMKGQVAPQKNLAAMEKVANEFIDHPVYPADVPLSVADAQKLKTGTYKEIGESYGKPMKAGAVEAKKAIARGLKEEIATAVPEAAGLNARESQLMAAGEALGPAAARDANADPLGLLFAAHNPQLFLAGLINRHAAIKSLIANGAWKMAGSVAKVSPQAIRAAALALAQSPEPEK